MNLLVIFAMDVRVWQCERLDVCIYMYTLYIHCRPTYVFMHRFVSMYAHVCYYVS